MEKGKRVMCIIILITGLLIMNTTTSAPISFLGGVVTTITSVYLVFSMTIAKKKRDQAEARKF